MRTIALCWELGGGFGHLTTLLPVARAFQARGDRMFLIARDLWTAGRVFEGSDVRLLQAPFRHGTGLQFDVTPTFAYVLHNVGFSGGPGLSGLADGWRNLFDALRPDLVISDHSPTALLAARGNRLPAVVWGTGFYCPPRVDPLPAFPIGRYDPGQAAAVEANVLARANEILAGRRAKPVGPGRRPVS